MSQVHTFTLLTELFADTRLPLQYPGNGASPAPRQVRLDVLLAWLQDNLDFPAGDAPTAQEIADGDSLVIAAGTLIETIVFEYASGSRTVKVGTSAGGDDILEETTIASNAELAHTVNRYWTNSGTSLWFTVTGGPVSVVVFKRMKG